MPKADAVARSAIRVWKPAILLLVAFFALSVSAMALTEDGWTAPGGVGSFSGVVGHWIDSDWVMRCSLLACRALAGQFSDYI